MLPLVKLLGEILNSLDFILPFFWLMIFPFWRILKRAGFSPYMALFGFIPFLGHLIIGAMLAFARWPRTTAATQTLEEAR